MFRDDYAYRVDEDIELDEDTLAEMNRSPVAPGKRTLTQDLGPRAGYVFRKASSAGDVAPTAREQLRRARSTSGHALPESLVRRFDAAIRPDVAEVRVHTDEQAHNAAVAYRARALAVDRDIFFRSGEYSPETEPGIRLIAHEVAHTLQQCGAGSPPQAKLEVSEPGDALEREADTFADRFVAGFNEPHRREPLPVVTTNSSGVRRKEADGNQSESNKAAAYLNKHGDRLMRLLKIRTLQAQIASPDSPYARLRPSARRVIASKVLDAIGPDTITLARWQQYVVDSAESAIKRGLSSDGKRPDVNEFRHTVVDELYKQLLLVLTSSLWRMIPRYLAERNQALLDEENKLGRSVQPDDIEARPANVLLSHPMDRLVVDALCSGIVEFDVDGYRQSTPGAGLKRAPSAKLRPVSFQFERTDPTCRVVRVSAPGDARPEEVAAELYGDPALSYLLLPARPLFAFRFPPSKRLSGGHHERWVSAARANGVSPDRVSRDVRENEEPLDALVALSGLGGQTIDPATTFMIEGTAAQPDSRTILDRFAHIATELTAVQSHAVTFGRADALAGVQSRIEARQAQCLADASLCGRWQAQSATQLQILRTVTRGLSVAARFAEQQQAGCADQGTDISKSLHAPLVRIASAFVEVAAVSDLPEVARPRLVTAQQRLDAYPVEVMEETLRYARSVVGWMAATRDSLGEQYKSPPGSIRITNLEATLRGKLLVIRENLLHNPLAALAAMLEVENEVRQLQFEARVGGRIRMLENLLTTLRQFRRRRIDGLTIPIRRELRALTMLWWRSQPQSGYQNTLAELEERLNGLVKRQEFTNLIKVTIEFVEDETAKKRIIAMAQAVGVTTLFFSNPLGIGGYMRTILAGSPRAAGLLNVGANLTLQVMDHGSTIDQYDIPSMALDYVVGAMGYVIAQKVQKIWPIGRATPRQAIVNYAKSQVAVWAPYSLLVGTLRSAVSQKGLDVKKGTTDQVLEGFADEARRIALLKLLRSRQGRKWFPKRETDPKFVYVKSAAKLLQKLATRQALSQQPPEPPRLSPPTSPGLTPRHTGKTMGDQIVSPQTTPGGK